MPNRTQSTVTPLSARSTGEGFEEVFLAIESLKKSLCRVEDSHACKELSPRLDAMTEQITKLMTRDAAVAKLADEESVLLHAQQALERAWRFFKDDSAYKMGRLERSLETLEAAQDNIEKEQGSLEKNQRYLVGVVEKLEDRVKLLYDKFADATAKRDDPIT